MRLWSLLNARNPVWRGMSVALMGGVLGLSAWYLYRGRRPILPTEGGQAFHGTVGARGTLTEQLGRGRFVLAYDTLLGEERNLRVIRVKGTLEEPEVRWEVVAPEAHRAEGVWLLNGPLTVVSRVPGSPRPTGQGRMDGAGPALRWEDGHWRGLGPLVWTDLEGQGKGIWHIPAGWVRQADGRLKVDRGPVVWEALESGPLHRLTAQRLDLGLGLQTGRLESVEAEAEGGRLQAGAAEIAPDRLRWHPPLTFQRQDGWSGQAQGGEAPRPPAGAPLQALELVGFQARRPTPEGVERLEARGARWTSAGLRLEGSVVWEQPLDGHRLALQAPRVLSREGAGSDLPPDLSLGESRAEGQPVLTWGRRSLTSPRMSARRTARAWAMDAPVLGRSELGTFTAGAGGGSPRRWSFAGPVRAQIVNGGELRGDRLLWEEAVWTFLGRPATWTRVRERIAAPRILREADRVVFPEGLNGALAGIEGDVLIRADQGEGRAGSFTLQGRVECRGLGWRLNADRISVTLGPGNTVKLLDARGAVTLRGRMGEGWGEALVLDPVQRSAMWSGRVRGLAEVQR